MFTNEIALYGDIGAKTRKLKDIGLFDRILDIYIAGGIIGIIYGKKGEKKSESSSVKIFAGQLNNELSRLRYLSSLAFLIENSHMKGDEVGEKELLRQAFGDWFCDSDSDNNKKYGLFELYAIEGIDILFNKIVGDSSDEERYYQNFYDFIEEINKIEIVDDLDRTIEGVLNI